jgi:DNA helicase-2/ATP-dependent DNA helicase PcrA
MNTQELNHVWDLALADLDPSQHEAVTALDGPVLVVAGPGSGKTRVLTRRLAALVGSGVRPSSLLAVTFTNKAAAEMRDRLADLIGPDEAKYAQVSTFHSLCARLLRQYHDYVGLPRQFTILDSEDSSRVVRDVAKRAGHLEALDTKDANAFVKQISSGISNAKNFGRTPQELMSSPEADNRRVGELMAAYNEQLQAQGSVDFDDLLTFVHWLLMNVPEVADTLRARWSHVSVDEFQDTNAVQYAIIAQLVATTRNLCVVGDADQSIYAFRGAQPSVVQTFTTDFSEATVVILKHNYRSTAAICEVSKAVISANASPHRSPQSPVRDTGSKVALTGYVDDREEARSVVDMIRSRGARPLEHAVLVRTNALTRSIELELTAAHLDYEVVGATRFYDRAEVKDTMAWLRLAFNDRDAAAFTRAVAVPKRGIGQVSIDKLKAAAIEEGISITDAAHRAAKGSSAAAAKLAEFLKALEAVRDAAAWRGPVAALRVILTDVGVRAVVRERDKKERTSREENLDQLLTHAAEHDIHPDGPVAAMEAYLESVSLLESTDGDETDDLPTERVQILTIHAAKGKEFKHVYVIGLEDEVLPHARALDSGQEDELEEERRLLFVATSRAQRTLNLSWCSQRMRFGKVMSSLPSRFLDEIPRSLLTVEDPKPQTVWNNNRGNGFGSAGSSYGSSGSYGSASSRPAPRSFGSGEGPRNSAGAVTFGTKKAKAPVSTALDGVTVGERVTHTMFGPGIVSRVAGTGSNMTLEVKFDDGAVKTLLASRSPMSREAA